MNKNPDTDFCVSTHGHGRFPGGLEARVSKGKSGPMQAKGTRSSPTTRFHKEKGPYAVSGRQSPAGCHSSLRAPEASCGFVGASPKKIPTILLDFPAGPAIIIM